MVCLLVTVIQSVGDKSNAKSIAMKCERKGKWKVVSEGMMVKGHMVSSRQCEDEYNDMNKHNKWFNCEKTSQVIGKQFDIVEPFLANDMEIVNLLSLHEQDNQKEFLEDEIEGYIN